MKTTMELNVGDPIVWAPHADRPEVKAGTITKLNKSYAWIDNYHKPEDCIDRVYIYPAKYLEALLEVLQTRARLKKAYEDSIGQIFELRNRIIREQEDI